MIMFKKLIRNIFKNFSFLCIRKFISKSNKTGIIRIRIICKINTMIFNSQKIINIIKIKTRNLPCLIFLDKLALFDRSLRMF